MERRATPRYKCQGSVQVREQNSKVRTWGSVTEISLHGCYLEMPATLPTGTTVFLQLDVSGKRVDAKGEVRGTYPLLGMGIAFREMTSQNRLKLGEMVLLAAREILPAAAKVNSAQPAWVMPPVSDPTRLVEALGNFFSRCESLSREEFMRMVASEG